MNVRQIEACAQRLPDLERQGFITLHRQADLLLQQSWAARKQAWALYRRCIGIHPEVKA